MQLLYPRKPVQPFGFRKQPFPKSLQVRKKDGRIEPFLLSKIEASVVAAGSDTGEYSEAGAQGIIDGVINVLRSDLRDRRLVTVLEIRNLVEPAIAKAGYFATAKYYILYGTHKGQRKDTWQIREPVLADHSLAVVTKRYVRTDMEGRPVESAGQMLWRVARTIAKAEIAWGDERDVEQTAREFFDRMVDFRFVCSGKAMFEAGNDGGTGQLSACFVLGIEDSIAAIFKTLGEAALVHKNNGGTGFNFSKIRPRGDKVKNVPGAASGPVDFLQAYSAALSKILQGAKRQGANIGILNADHPDIEDFIRLKDEDGTIKNFNISVGVPDEFMRAVRDDKVWSLVNPRTGETVRKLKTRKLFQMIVAHAHQTGDPGLMFLDTFNRDNPTPQIGRIEATNPCGEIGLLPYESCNLTSICLQNHVKSSENSEYSEDQNIRMSEYQRSRKSGLS